MTGQVKAIKLRHFRLYVASLPIFTGANLPFELRHLYSILEPYLQGNFQVLPSSREGGQCKDQCIVIFGIKICVNDCQETTGKPTAEGPTTEGPTTEMPTTIKVNFR